MTRRDIDCRPAGLARLHERIIDWLGAQGPLLLTVYMCGAVALAAFAIERLG